MKLLIALSLLFCLSSQAGTLIIVGKDGSQRFNYQRMRFDKSGNVTIVVKNNVRATSPAKLKTSNNSSPIPKPPRR